MTATYIRNRCYVQRIKSTPYGLVTGLKPNIAKLHAFGTLCYPYVHNAKKLEPRSRKGYIVGYDRDSPSYLVYYPKTKNVMKHRVVKFTEKFQEISSAADPIPELIADSEDNLQPDVPSDENTATDEVAENQMSRYPRRNRQVPIYLHDYDLTDRDETSDSVNHIDFCYMLDTLQSYEDATNREDALKWKIAMDTEIQSLIDSNTFIESELPAGKTLVGGKWVYALKGDPKDPIYKDRYVAKGYSQIQGIDYAETFLPTARRESVRTLIQLAVQMDVKVAYLHAPIDREVYVEKPIGYKSGDNVWRLCKSLYWLKQSGRNWQSVLHDFLKKLNFVQSTADLCVFIKGSENGIIVLLV